ncbi:MAG: hypothetical protein JXA71_08235 [Chitinispirillaceae bacterium]|nr:hypothetical protein [Chitinispirillaceae bacterium]
MRKRIPFSSAIAFTAGAGIVSLLSAFPVHETGNGVRSMGLAGNVTALADDPSASYWNPGGLSFLTQREVFAGAGFIGQANNVTVQGRDNTDNLMRLRISSAGVLYPVPVERGGLAFSLSFSNAFNFDDILSYSSTRTDDLGAAVATDSDFKMYGGLNYWTAAGAVQVGPGVGVGASLSLITGNEIARFIFLRTTDGRVTDTLNNDFKDHYEREYLGVDVRGGLLYRPGKNLRLGVRVVLPCRISFTESIKSFSPRGSTVSKSTHGIRGELLSSFEGALGAVYELHQVLFSFDLRGRVPYLLLRPIEDIPDGSDASHFKAGIGGGIEFPLLLPALTGRAAYAFDEYDTHRFAVQYDDEMPDFNADPSETERDLHSLGAGITANFTGISLEFGYRIGWWQLLTNEIIQESHLLHQAQLALRWRF